MEWLYEDGPNPVCAPNGDGQDDTFQMLTAEQVEQRFPLSFNFHLTEMCSHICGVQCCSGQGNVILYEEGGSL